MRRLPMRWLGALIMLLFAWPAAAHLTPNSELRLDFGDHLVRAEIVIPLSEIGFALGRPLPAEAGPLPPADDALIRRYMADRMIAASPDGRRWTIAIRAITVRTDEGAPDLRIAAEMTPPPGAGVRRFDLTYAAVIDRVANHFVLVVARSDFSGGHLAAEPQIIGGLQGKDHIVHVDRGSGSAGAGFLAAIGLGMHHIAEGHDHLLFLVTLLLPAPLIAGAARWGGYGGVRLTARRLAGVVTAFTIGHSITLLGGAFLGWQLPARPVEVMIAVSIFVSAIHAARPLFAGREPWVAGGFGLIHGLAFATIVGHVGVEPVQKAQAILGFNLGIECVQLLVVAAVLPALLLLANTRLYQPFRTIMAVFSGIAALAWIVERVFGTENPIGRAIDLGLGHAPWILLGLTIVAVLAWLREYRTNRVVAA